MKSRQRTRRSPPSDRTRLLDREQGILAFNERVLTLAEDPAMPLLERLRFLTIVSSNLDEFFEVRIADLRQLMLYARSDTADIRAGVDAAIERARALVARQYRFLNRTLVPALAAEGIRVLEATSWTAVQHEWAEGVFTRDIEPLLTPIALDPAHPFPRVLNKSLNFVVRLEGRDAFGRRADIAIVQAPRVLPRVIAVPPEIAGVPHGVVALTSIVQGFVDRLFPGLRLLAVHPFRVTRNSELFVDDDEITDLRSALEDELTQRHYGDAVRLEVSSDCDDKLVERLLAELDLAGQDCFRVEGPVNLMRLAQVIDLVERPDLKFAPYVSSIQPALRDADRIFDAIRAGDRLLHHPYESFLPVVSLLRSAASDPAVVAIKQTVYRTGADSQLMESLLAAAIAGKEVTVVLELMARFDEETNINWAARLEQAGAHVIYGVVGHKTHAKMLLVVRREADGLRRYAHLGTGNYHPSTARLYEDFGLMTCDEDICADVHEVFRRLTGVGDAGVLRALWQSPFTLATSVIESIAREADHAKAGRRGYVAAKINALLDPQVIEALYEASAAGVKIDLIVRGVCALRPGVPGLSENIRVRSIVGRFLEHSRVFYFHNDGRKDVWLSSADWMERNLHRRVETAFPIRDKRLRDRVIREAITIPLRDNDSAWVMDGEGNYTRRRPRRAKPFVAQRALMKLLGEDPVDT
ncbi:MAG: polyphosphate kinase 1 [Burkholderiaceae bacterium]